MIYIILAHNSPEMLNILINKLMDKKNHFIIHIDEKHNIEPFIKAVSGKQNCHFTPKRYASHWGSFALIEATLHAFEFIKKKFKNNQRIVLLSGETLPIKSNKFINHYFSSHQDTIFIDYHPIPRKIWYTGGIHRFPSYETISESIKFYGGSQWFSIPRKALNIIFKFLKESPDFLNYFKYVKIPDESFFQTLFMNCEHPYIDKNMKNQNLHYIKWDKPYLHPRILTLRDIRQINKSRCLFARKFNIIQSTEILSLLNGEKRNSTIESKNKIAVIYLTDDIKRYKGRYSKLKNQVKEVDVFSIVTNKINYKNAKDSLLYEHKYWKEMGYKPFNEKSIIPGSTYFALLYFFKQQNPKYDYYWLIEDDVVFNASWEIFFKRFKNNKADYISCYNTPFNDAKHWFWWDTLSTEESITTEYKMRTFYPISRLSSKALHFLDHILQTKISGHGEVLLPTLFNLNGFSIFDLAYNEPTINQPLIIPCTEKAIGDKNNGTYRYRPNITKAEIQGEYLFHPVKFNI